MSEALFQSQKWAFQPAIRSRSQQDCERQADDRLRHDRERRGSVHQANCAEMRELMQHVAGFEEQAKGIMTDDPKSPGFEALLKHFRPKDVFGQPYEVVSVGGKFLFKKYQQLLEASKVRWKLVADRDYASDIGPADIKTLFRVDAYVRCL